jgi:type 1 glutamine amidotransferase
MKLPHLLTTIAFASILILSGIGEGAAAEEDKPHVVLVCGTLHYSPELTMPVFARELEKFGCRTTVVMGEGDPEKKTENVLPGIEVLAEADLVMFFMRFLKLPDEEWQPIEDYLESGKPVIGLRTANHSFKYPKEHPRFEWNDGFGRRALGTPYIVHQSSPTDITVETENASHPILSHVSKQEWVSPGTLYLAKLEPGCTILVNGSGTGKVRLLKKSFGEIQVKKFETAPVAWAWQNEWGAKVFGTSFGHPGDFAEESFNRMLVNAVHWSLDLPVPSAEAEISTWKIERADKKPKP